MAYTTTEIPLPVDLANYTIRVTLTGREYELGLDYNGRLDRWYLTVKTADGAPIRAGMKVVCNWAVMRRTVSELRPPGDLIFTDTSAVFPDPPGYSELGRRVRLMYVERVEEPPASVVSLPGV